MNLIQDIRILIALEHHAEGLTFEQIAAKHGLNPKTIYYRYRSALAILGLAMRPKTVTAQDIGISIQRRFEAGVQRDSRMFFDSPQAMFFEVERERRDDERKAIERKAIERTYGEGYWRI